MKNRTRNWFFRIFIGAMSIFSIASLSVGFVQLNREISLKNDLETAEMSTHGGGGGRTSNNGLSDENKDDIDDNKRDNKIVVISDEDKQSWDDVIAQMIEDGAYDPATDFKGQGTQASPYLISCAEDLAYVAYGSKNYKIKYNAYMSFTADIYLNDGQFKSNGTYVDGGDGVLYEWEGIDHTLCYMRSVKGNGHTIYGMYFNQGAETIGRGLFYGSGNLSWVDTIDSLNFSNIYIRGKNAWIYFYAVKNLSNCTVISGYLSGHDNFLSAVVEKVENCKNYANFSGYSNSMFRYVRSSINGCDNYGKFSTTRGAIVENLECNKIENCNNYGALSLNQYGGTIVGYTKNNYALIKNCNNYGNINSQNYSGGILGSGSKKVDIIECGNYGIVKGTNPASIVGSLEYKNSKSVLKITDCYACSGGTVVGYMNGSGNNYTFEVNVSSCYFDYTSVSSVSHVFTYRASDSVKGGGGTFNILNVQVELGDNSQAYIFRGSDNFTFNLKYVLVNVNKNYTLDWNTEPTVNANGVIIQKVNKPLYFYGDNFYGFFYKWKTGKVGLKFMERYGLYQGNISKEWLLNTVKATQR